MVVCVGGRVAVDRQGRAAQPAQLGWVKCSLCATEMLSPSLECSSAPAQPHLAQHRGGAALHHGLDQRGTDRQRAAALSAPGVEGGALLLVAGGGPAAAGGHDGAGVGVAGHTALLAEPSGGRVVHAAVAAVGGGLGGGNGAVHARLIGRRRCAAGAAVWRWRAGY